jgi:hypothetical protein
MEAGAAAAAEVEVIDPVKLQAIRDGCSWW